MVVPYASLLAKFAEESESTKYGAEIEYVFDTLIRRAKAGKTSTYLYDIECATRIVKRLEDLGFVVKISSYISESDIGDLSIDWTLHS